MTSGKVKCKSASTDFTVNAQYDLLSLGYEGSLGGVFAIVRNDAGQFQAVPVNTATFEVVTLSAMVEVL